MAKKKTKKRQLPEIRLEDENLDRFAGSSDEEDGDPPVNYDAEDDGDHEESEEEPEIDPQEETAGEDSRDDESAGIPEDDLGDFIDGNVDTGSKMANAMSRILGTNLSKHASAVLAKTKTPLQKLQQEEKEKARALRQKRQAKRERNLTALHIPLSVATSNSIQTEGQISVARELEQERLHRRVATRGVVALFNAIHQHQTGANSGEDAHHHKEVPKMTKHGFLDKIRNAADKQKAGDAAAKQDAASKQKGGWNALKDDYMMDPKKNWEDESEDGNDSLEGGPADMGGIEEEMDQIDAKRQRISA